MEHAESFKSVRRQKKSKNRKRKEDPVRIKSITVRAELFSSEMELGSADNLVLFRKEGRVEPDSNFLGQMLNWKNEGDEIRLWSRILFKIGAVPYDKDKNTLHLKGMVDSSKICDSYIKHMATKGWVHYQENMMKNSAAA
jgi:hypothetical protein